MKYFLLLLLIVGCSPKVINWRTPSNDELVPVYTTKSPRCIQLFLKLGNPDKYKWMVTSEMLEEAGVAKGVIKKVKRRQADSLNFMYSEAKRATKLRKKAENELYTLTKKYTKRLKNGFGDYIHKKFNVGYEHKFGFLFDEAANKTRFSTFGVPGIAESMEVAIYKGAEPISANLVTKVPMTYIPNEGRWVAETPGDLQGLWYRYNVTAKKGVYSDYSEPIPRHFSFVDQSVSKTSVKNQTAQIYYLPDPAIRPKAPPPMKNPNIWEINIADVRPPDVDEKYWGTTEAITRSKLMMEKISRRDGIEIMPPRNAVMFENIGDNTMYLHHWAYMGTDFGFDERIGGIEGIIDLVDTMHLNGKFIYIDHVYQHTANENKTIEWLLRDFHMARDITGCGNTLNLAPGTTLEQLTMQNYKRDLFLIGFDGSRPDLAGAIDKRTYINLRDTAHAGGKKITGEPYGYGGGWNIFPHADGRAKIIGDKWGPPGNSALWDAEARKTLRYCATHPCESDVLRKHLSGGNPNPAQRYWKTQSGDATTILETHDAATAAFDLVSYEQAVRGEYQALAQAQFFHANAQGEILTGPMQAAAMRHSDLNDTPVDYFRLPAHQAQFEKNWGLAVADYRKKYSAYFSWDWENTISEGHRISYLPPPNKFAYGIHHKSPPPDFKGVAPREELLVLHNTNDFPVTFGIPRGRWRTIVDSSIVKIDLNGSLYPHAVRDYMVPPHTSVALAKRKGRFFK